jgi:hypothetical protein
VLAAHLRHLHSSLLLAQHANDLLFGEPASLHPSVPLRVADSTHTWRSSFYAWKAKFGGMSVSDAKRLKQLEGENAKLKKLLAEAMLDVAVLKDITSRKW